MTDSKQNTSHILSIMNDMHLKTSDISLKQTQSILFVFIQYIDQWAYRWRDYVLYDLFADGAWPSVFHPHPQMGWGSGDDKVCI